METIAYSAPTHHLTNATDVVMQTSTAPPSEDYMENHVARFLYTGPSIFFLIIGTFGNILSFIVFNRNTMRQSVTSVYFRVLAVSDTLVLYSATPVFFIMGAFDLDIKSLDTFSCKFWLPLLVVSCYHSCWILVFIAVDRFIGVYVPHKYRTYCSQRRAIIGMVILFIVVSGTVGAFWVTALGINPADNTCGLQSQYVPFYVNVFRWLDLSLLNLVPTIILVSLNIAIIVRVTKATAVRQSTMTSTKGGYKSKKVSSPTAILLSVSLVYILCTIPTSTAFLVKASFGSSPHAQAQVLLYGRACETLYLANHAVNFFLYCVSGTGFRKELRGICCKGPSKSTSGTESTGMSPTRSVRVTESQGISPAHSVKGSKGAELENAYSVRL